MRRETRGNGTTESSNVARCYDDIFRTPPRLTKNLIKRLLTLSRAECQQRPARSFIPVTRTLFETAFIVVLAILFIFYNSSFEGDFIIPLSVLLCLIVFTISLFVRELSETNSFNNL